MNRALLSGLLWVTILPASVLDAQERRLTPLPEKLTATTRVAIERLADSLTQERLPANALRDKAAEGALKGAADAAILGAVRSLAQRLRDARAAMGLNASDDELMAGASVLYSGVTPDALARFTTVQRERSAAVSITIPLTVVAELALKVPASMALSSVESLLNRGAKDAHISAFRESVTRDLLKGSAPRDALDAGVRTTLGGIKRVP